MECLRPMCITKKMPSQYRVRWIVCLSQVTGQGSWTTDRTVTEAWVQYCKGKYPDMIHWFEAI